MLAVKRLIYIVPTGLNGLRGCFLFYQCFALIGAVPLGKIVGRKLEFLFHIVSPIKVPDAQIKTFERILFGMLKLYDDVFKSG